MDRKVKNRIGYITFVAVGLGLTVWVFAGQDFAALWDLLRETRWVYIGLSLVLTFAGHWVRAARWRQLVEAGGEMEGRKAGVGPYLVALMNGYLVNLGVPRLGEFTRCISLSQLTGQPVVRAGGTVVVERLVDLACLAIVLAAAFALSGEELAAFFKADIFGPLGEKVSGKWWLLVALGVVGVSGLLGIFLFLKMKPQNSIVQFFQKQAIELKAGLWGLVSLKGKWRFLGYSILIWTSYFSAPYLTLYALGFGGPEAVKIGFVVFAVGSIARTVPAPAGSMGPYHWLVMHALLLYGFSETEGLAVATLNHAVQTVFYLIAGGLSFFFWGWLGRKKL